MPTARVRQPQPPRAPSAPAAPKATAAFNPAGAITQHPGTPVYNGATGINQNPASHQYGQTYTTLPAPGGTYHLYSNGQRIFVPARAPAAAAAPPATPSAGSAAAAAPDPRDSTYYATSAQDLFNRNQKLGQIRSEGTQDAQDHAEALRRLVENQPKAIENARETYNKQGLFYSGKLGEREGDINTDYARQQGDMQKNFDRRDAAREAARTALEQGAPLDEAARLAEAVDRQIGRDTATADAGGLVAPDQQPDVSAPPSAAQPRQTKRKYNRRAPAISGSKRVKYKARK
jgi:hypothetical protein